MKTQSKFKKVLSLLLSFSFILSMVSLPAVHAASPVTLTVSNATEAAGKNVVISINISANSNISIADILLQYDTTKLEYVSGIPVNATGGVVNPSRRTNGNLKTISLTYAGTFGFTEAGSLMDITFTIKSDMTGSTPLTLTTAEFVDNDDNDVIPTITNGNVTVQEQVTQKTITFDTDGGSTVGSVSGLPGTTVPPISNPTKDGYVFDKWDPAIPTVFPSTDITIKAIWKLAPVTLTVSNVSGATDDVVTVNVDMSANSNLGNCDLYLTYDNTKLTYVDKSGTSSFSGSYETGLKTVGNSTTVHFIFAVNDAITEAGSIFSLKFKVNAGWTGSTPLTLTTDNFADDGFNQIAVAITNGTVTNTSAATSTITFDSKGGSNVALSTGEVNTTVQKPTDPTKTGYRFGGWYTDEALTQPVSWPYTRTASNVTFYAKWVATSTITIDRANGSAVTTITQDEGSLVTKPSDPTKDGYRFLGWSPEIPTTIPVDDITCVALWGKLVTITFNSNGGTAVGSIEDIEHASIAKPAADPTKTNYTFNGWYLDEGLTQAVTWNYTLPSSNVTFYAKWTINQSSITFNSNGGSDVSKITQNINDSIQKPVDPTKADNIFAGWYTDEGLNNPVTWPYTLTATDVTFYAKWTATSTITFVYDNGSPDTTLTLAEGALVTAPTNPSKAGFTFSGWSPAVPGTMPVDNMTCTAQWDQISTITFDSKGGSAIGSIQGKVNDSIAKPATDPTKADNIFDGWYKDAELTQAVSWNYTLTADNVTFYAKWTPTSTITFVYENGLPDSTITLAEGALVTAPTDPSYSGYTFNGWDPEVPGTMPVDNMTCVAKWEPNQTTTYAITWDIDGVLTTDRVEEGVTPTAPVIPSRQGYTTSWSPEIEQASSDVTYTAVWTPNTNTVYTVEHYKENLSKTGYDKADTETLRGTTDTTVAAKAKAYTGFSAATSPSGVIAGDGSLVLKQYYTRNTFDITWTANGGIFTSTQSSNDIVVNLAYGAALTPPEVTKYGYSVSTWSPQIPATVIGEKTYKPVWASIFFTITWNAGGGKFDGGVPTTTSSVKYDGNPQLTAPIPTRTGYTFNGWNPAVDSVMNNGITTYTAKWTPVKYTITWLAGDGKFTGDKDFVTTQEDFDSTPEGPVPTLAGYDFIGWNPAVTPVNGTATYTAKWKIQTYTITFDAAGGVFEDNTSITTRLVDYFITPMAPAVSKVGHTFDGWTPTIEKATKNATYTANWTAKPVITITFNTDGGNDIAPIKGYLGETVTPPENPKKDGFKFLNWSPEIPSAFPNEDVTLKALWTSAVDKSVMITVDGNDIGSAYKVKVSFIKLYSSVTLQLGYKTNFTDFERVEYISSNPNVVIDQTGKITNKGFFSRSSDITVNVYDVAGNVAAHNTVNITFYKFDTSGLPSYVQTAITAMKLLFTTIIDWFNKM